MPNWCSNTFTVTGPQPDIDRLTALVVRENLEKDWDKGGDLIFDFNGLVPMPEAFSRINYDAMKSTLTLNLACTDPDTPLSVFVRPETGIGKMLAADFAGYREMTVRDWLNRMNDDPKLAGLYGYCRQVFEAARICYLEYGADTPYCWCCQNWGVGGNAFWSSISSAAGSLTVSFESAWGPPEQFYRTLVERFPMLEFEAVYLEEGCGVAGRYGSCEGRLIDEPVPDVGNNVRRFAIEVFGYEYEDDEDEDDK